MVPSSPLFALSLAVGLEWDERSRCDMVQPPQRRLVTMLAMQTRSHETRSPTMWLHNITIGRGLPQTRNAPRFACIENEVHLLDTPTPQSVLPPSMPLPVLRAAQRVAETRGTPLDPTLKR